MSRSDADRLDDIANAITSIRSHLEHGPISVEIVIDAVAMRLLEIGEAAKGLSPELTATEPEVDWSGAAGTEHAGAGDEREEREPPARIPEVPDHLLAVGDQPPAGQRHQRDVAGGQSLDRAADTTQEPSGRKRSLPPGSAGR